MGIKETIKKCRNSKKCRMSVIWILVIIVLLLIFFWKKATLMLVVILVFLAIAMWLEWFDYDVDLWKLWETWSYSESRVETVKDSDWNSVRIITGKCNSWDFDLNCADFSTQDEAQAKYQECADEIEANNPGIDTKKFDIYWLDGNNNGIVCEALPSE